MLVGIDIYSEAVAEARIMYSIITGIGCISGEAISKNEDSAKHQLKCVAAYNMVSRFLVALDI